MKKIVVLTLSIIVAWGVAVAQSTKNTKTRIVQAAQDTTVTYAGMKVFVPAGQTIILSQSATGDVLVRGHNVSGVKIGEGTISAKGPVLLAINPQSQVVRVAQGNNVQVTDGNGRMAEVSQGAAVSARDIRQATGPTLPPSTVTATFVGDVKTTVISNTDAQVQQTAVSSKKSLKEDVNEVPAFVAQTATSDIVSEQAVQDVETTVSKSAPRL